MEFFPEDEEGQAVVIAFLRSVVGLSNSEISSMTRLSVATVSRRLAKAMEMGILKQFVFCPSHDIEDKFAPYLRNLDLERKIQENVGKLILQSVMVVPSGEDLEGNRKKVGRAAAFRLLQKIKSLPEGADVRIGISWGRTLKSLVDGLREMKPVYMRDDLPSNSIEFVPLCGDFWLKRDVDYDSSAKLARDLTEIFPSSSLVSSLEMSFPAYIPRKFQEEKGIILEFLESIPSYKKVYGDGEKSLIHRLDGIITSVGVFPKQIPPSKSEAPFISSLLASEQIDENEFRELKKAGVVGDLLGYFFTDKGLKSEGDDIVARKNRCFLGPKPEHFSNCAKRARKGKAFIGVMIVTSGREKAKVLFPIIQAGCVNEIIIDSELAEELIELYEIE